MKNSFHFVKCLFYLMTMRYIPSTILLRYRLDPNKLGYAVSNSYTAV